MAAVAGSYARAYAEVVFADGVDPEQAIGRLNQMAALIAGNSELHHIFLNPSVPHEQKLSLLQAIIDLELGSKGKGLGHLRNFLAVLIDHKRIGIVQDIATQFKQELEARLGIAEAQISSARELSPREKQLLEQRLTTVTGKKLRATYAQDTSLLGGAVVRIGSTIYDGSVKGQLDRLRAEIAGD